MKNRKISAIFHLYPSFHIIALLRRVLFSFVESITSCGPQSNDPRKTLK